MISVLYPEDRKAPAEVDIAKEDIRAIAKNIIRAAVPKGGAPKTAGSLEVPGQEGIDGQSKLFQCFASSVYSKGKLRAERGKEVQ